MTVICNNAPSFLHRCTSVVAPRTPLVASHVGRKYFDVLCASHIHSCLDDVDDAYAALRLLNLSPHEMELVLSGTGLQQALLRKIIHQRKLNMAALNDMSDRERCGGHSLFFALSISGAMYMYIHIGR